MHRSSFLKASCGIFFFFILTISIFASGCSGIHITPLREGESIELQFDGPVTLSYFLKDGTEQILIVEDELELVLANVYQDADPSEVTGAERFYSYFRVTGNGGNLFLGMDPELISSLNDEIEFPDPTVIAQYLATAEFEFLGRDEGLLKNPEPIQMAGNFLGTQANRFQYSCVDPVGNTVFVYDLEVPKLCNSNNHDEISEELFPHDYSREEIVDRTAGNRRSLLTTFAEDGEAASPPLVLRIVNVNFDPEGDPMDGTEPENVGADPSSSGPDSQGGCSLQRTDSKNAHFFSGSCLLALGILLVSRRRATFHGNQRL